MTPSPERPTARRHVYEADVVRVLTFAAVIGVHTVSQTNGNASVGANGLVMLLHFTREAFFVLTGFVLVHQYFDRPYRVRHFWARRFLTVGVPYLVWTVAYTGLQWWQGPRTMSFATWLYQLGYYTVHGDAWFHLYFLLVSMQIYLIYPLIAGLIRATAGHHGVLLAVSGAVQIALLSVLTYAPPHSGIGGWYTDQAAILVTTYQFYVLLGAVVAVHLDACADWVGRHTATIVAAFVGTGVTAEIWYLVASRRQLASSASDVLQPIVLPWSVATVAGLFAVGIAWSRRRRSGSRLDRALRTASDRSFGIYLSHPAVLWLILWSDDRWLRGHLSGPWLAVVVYPLTVVGAVAVTELLRRSPVSLALTGRPRLPSRPITAPRTNREDTTHAHHRAAPADPRSEASPAGPDDDDRRRATHPSVHRRVVELQRAD